MPKHTDKSKNKKKEKSSKSKEKRKTSKSPLTGVDVSKGHVGGLQMVARTWVITVNKAEEFVSFEEAIANPTDDFKKKVRFVVWQYEIGIETGHKHIQAYAELTSPQKMATVKSTLKIPTAHLEKRAGTQEQAIAYCKKDETRAPGNDTGPFTYGELAANGKKKYLADAVQVLKQSGVSRVAEEHPETFVKHSRGLMALGQELTRKQWKNVERDLVVYVFYGATGTGKTRNAINQCVALGKSYYILDPQKIGQLWFDGYQQEEVLIIDEFDGTWIALTTFLRILDRYQMSLPVKGSSTQAAWTTVFLTSNIPWTSWYSNSTNYSKEALARRIHHSYEFFKPTSSIPRYHQRKWCSTTMESTGPAFCLSMTDNESWGKIVPAEDVEKAAKIAVGIESDPEDASDDIGELSLFGSNPGEVVSQKTETTVIQDDEEIEKPHNQPMRLVIDLDEDDDSDDGDLVFENSQDL